MEKQRFEPITETLKRFGRDVIMVMAGHQGHHFAEPPQHIPFEEEVANTPGWTSWQQREPDLWPAYMPPTSNTEAPNGWTDQGEYHDPQLRLEL